MYGTIEMTQTHLENEKNQKLDDHSELVLCAVQTGLVDCAMCIGQEA